MSERIGATVVEVDASHSVCVIDTGRRLTRRPVRNGCYSEKFSSSYSSAPSLSLSFLIWTVVPPLQT